MIWIFSPDRFDTTFFKSFDVSKYTGFVYLITNNITGKKYIGQKTFWNKVAVPPSKGYVRKRYKKVESQWKQYWGSNDELLKDVKELGKNSFSREVLYVCNSKAQMNYWETYEIMNRHAIPSPDYYNKWVSVRVSANQLP